MAERMVMTPNGGKVYAENVPDWLWRRVEFLVRNGARAVHAEGEMGTVIEVYARLSQVAAIVRRNRFRLGDEADELLREYDALLNEAFKSARAMRNRLNKLAERARRRRDAAAKAGKVNVEEIKKVSIAPGGKSDKSDEGAGGDPGF